MFWLNPNKKWHYRNPCGSRTRLKFSSAGRSLIYSFWFVVVGWLRQERSVVEDAPDGAREFSRPCYYIQVAPDGAITHRKSGNA